MSWVRSPGAESNKDSTELRTQDNGPPTSTLYLRHYLVTFYGQLQRIHRPQIRIYESAPITQNY